MRAHNYVQSGIGDCGHIITLWPQLLSSTRWRNGRRVPEYICEECTQEKYGMYYNPDGLSVWVSTVVEKETDEDAKPKAPPKPKKKKDPVCSICRNKGHLYTSCPLLRGQQTITPPNG